jgi:hypothetical protein
VRGSVRGTDPGVAGLGNGFGTGPDLELGQDRGDPVPDGLLGQEQPSGDRRVVGALGDEPEYVVLALAELREGLGALAGEQVPDARGGAGADDELTTADGAATTNAPRSVSSPARRRSPTSTTTP